MAKLKLLLQIVIVIVLASVLLSFWLNNRSAVFLDLLFIELHDIPVANIVLLSFFLGGLLGLLVRFPGSLWMHFRDRQHKRKIEQQGKALAKLSQTQGAGKK